MKIWFILFFSTFFLLYGFANYYVFYRGWQTIPEYLKYIKPYYISFAILVSLSYILSRFLDHTSLDSVNTIFTWIGSFWMAALLYFLLIALLFDLIRLMNLWFGFIPITTSTYLISIKFKLLLLFAGFVLIVLMIGHYNAIHPVIRTVNIKINKVDQIKNELRIVAVSDIHMGMLVGKSRIENLVRDINMLKPDVVVLVGDILDEVQMPIIRNKTGDPIKNIVSTYGVYGITGNHEYIGGIQKSINYINSLNIKLIRDTAFKIDGKLYLIGREDKDMVRFTGKQRKSLSEIMIDVDKSLPLILLDHQPYNLDDAINNGIDLQISGHTHHGQFWPVNYITQKIFEVSRGYLKKQNSQFYIMTGFGTWGPPVRLGNRPEIVLFKLTSRE